MAIWHGFALEICTILINCYVYLFVKQVPKTLYTLKIDSHNPSNAFAISK
jgi:hypothetical protein